MLVRKVTSKPTATNESEPEMFQFERKESMLMMNSIADENEWYDPEIAHESI